jgi:hypothetical protein
MMIVFGAKSNKKKSALYQLFLDHEISHYHSAIFEVDILLAE